MTVESTPIASTERVQVFLDENGYFVQSNEEFFFEQLLAHFSPRPSFPDCVGGRGVKPDA